MNQENLIRKAEKMWTESTLLEEKENACHLLSTCREKDLVLIKVLSSWYESLGMVEEAVELWGQGAKDWMDPGCTKKLLQFYQFEENIENYLSLLQFGACVLKDPELIIQRAEALQSTSENHVEAFSDENEIVQATKSAALLGHASSLKLLGEWAMINGKPSLDYYLKAAEAGDVSSMVITGSMLYEGEGCAKSIPRAIELFTQAARSAYNGDLVKIADWYSTNNDGFEADPEKAFALYSEAYQNGDYDSALKLADCFAQGIGCEKDVQEAIVLYQVSADRGTVQALPKLARCILYEFPERVVEAERAIGKFLLSMSPHESEIDPETLRAVINEL